MNEQSRDGVERSRAPARLPAALQASLSRARGERQAGSPGGAGRGRSARGAPGAEGWRVGGVQGEADCPSGERVWPVSGALFHLSSWKILFNPLPEFTG